MTNPPSPSPMESSRLESPSGLSVQMNANGSIRRMDHKDILVNLFLGNELEGGPANLYLRSSGETVETVPLLGPRSPAAFRHDRRGLVASGAWRDIRFTVALVLAESAPAWFWHVRLENTGRAPRTVELIHTQDLALAHYGAVRLNEYYVSQYLDHSPLIHPERGIVLASRQNLPMGGRNPWTIVGSLRRGVSYATDALQVHGLATRAGLLPGGPAEALPGCRRQHEHAMAAIQDASLRLEPGAAEMLGFFGGFREDHPAATSDADLICVDQILSLPEAIYPHHPSPLPAGEGVRSATLFSNAALLDALELTEADLADLFGSERREEEIVDGALLSFFAGCRLHVVLKAKELKVLRPHGHILRTGSGLTPDEAGLTSTVWMAGVFHSMVTQGHVSINRFLSTTHTYLSLFRSHGQRIFVEMAGAWRLLDVPSAFEISPEGCRWIYKHDDGLIEVRSLALTDRHELNLAVAVLSGEPVRCLVSSHVAVNGDDGAEAIPVRYERDEQGVFVHPIGESDVGRRFPDGGFRIDALPGTDLERVGGDELLFADGRSRNQPFLCLVTAPATEIGFRITGRLIGAAETAGGKTDADRYWTEAVAAVRIAPPVGSPLAGQAARLADILPWFAHNALVHYLSPRGLEQYSGGGWGTRDVTQGPLEMLLALGRFEPLRDLLIRVFKAQNADGDWPQWFMFFDRERNIRPADSHGDIVFWPILALAQYLSATENASLLEEPVPFFHPEGDGRAEWTALWQHVERALAVISARTIPGTRLAAYGHGDWNDALQPVDSRMRERLCSAWTVTLHYQTLTTLAQALRRLGRSERAADFDTMAENVLADFQRLLLVDGLLAGFAYFRNDGSVDYLLHPRDRTTSLSYSLLPMIHAIINGMLTPAQAETHLACIREHLLAPDGARLFDRPMAYRGGPQRIFQRAESSSFFGREIGLMYTHAHLRYAEALARYGDAEGFFEALCKVNPIGLRALVPAATLRQSNCYYSSSDAVFADRYQAGTEYDRVLCGEIPLEGGWRVYSSGAGIGLSLILRGFLGLRREAHRLVIDPVMPKSLDGLRIETQLLGRPIEVVYRVDRSGCGPTLVTLNGTDLPFTRGTNPYRLGSAEIPMTAVSERLADGNNRLTVRIN
ncbi:uncharacterized protein sS8_2956 [Methylocaldum marinum]|uniref:Uncharacterized protein n=1 Tax=Methylocaldum marinum TaxID=1432792 RepID=A0A250KYN6_9GAMM|nr:hypothetical protein [Methylocaldum marinum]BBA34899.1 uncharacterized protein sS8_2956 [Methylocaldum marinum]